MTGRELLRFVGAAVVFGCLAQAVAVHQGLSGGGRGWLQLAMWAPALAVLTSRPGRKRAVAALKRSGGRWFAVAFVVGWSLILIQAAFLAALGGGTWNSALFPLDTLHGGVTGIHGVAMALGVGAQSFAFFAVNLFLSVTLGSLIGGVFGGLGEELGWRAVLQPELERRWGPMRGTLAVGALWAYWHLPVNLAGYNDAVHPVWTSLLLFPAGVLAMAFSFGWLARKTGSVWPAAIAHGANNCLGAGFLLTPRSWAWDTATMLLSVAIVGGGFVWLTLRARAPAERSRLDADEAVGVAGALSAD